MSPIGSRAGAGLVTLAVAFLWVSGVASADSHEPAQTRADWDQARVTALAKELSQKVDAFYDTTYKAFDSRQLEGSQERYDLKDKLRLMQNEARHFHARVSGGDGYKKTRPIFQRLEEIRRDCHEDARFLFLTNDVLTAGDAVRDVMMRLHPYYLQH